MVAIGVVEKGGCRRAIWRVWVSFGVWDRLAVL